MLDNLSINKKYYWRVRAINSDGISAWSKSFNFTTRNSTGVENDLLQEYYNIDVIKNLSFYPNPATDEAKLFFVTEVSGACFVKLYDLQGRGIKFLSTQFVFKGENKLDLDVIGLPKGIYNLLLEIGTNKKSIEFVKN